jgi:hypothetical protein
MKSSDAFPTQRRKLVARQPVAKSAKAEAGFKRNSPTLSRNTKDAAAKDIAATLRQITQAKLDNDDFNHSIDE